MAKSRDRTEDFKDAIRTTAPSLGYNESKLAAVLASFILHKPVEKSPFTKAALKTLESISELECFIIKHRKDYVDMHRITEQERDNIEHEVVIFVKSCRDQINILQNMICTEEKSTNTKSWLHRRDDNINADVVAHKHGVVLILSERLHSVSVQFDRLRTIRSQEALNRAMPRRKINRVIHSTSSEQLSEPSASSIPELGGQEPTSRALRVQDQLMDDETRALQVELSSLLDAVQEAETKTVEISVLSHLMSTHVLQQAEQIEHLYEQAVEATNNVEQGNKELSQAIKRNSSSRTFLLLFLFVLTFSILFLDWYS